MAPLSMASKATTDAGDDETVDWQDVIALYEAYLITQFFSVEDHEVLAH